MMQHANHTRDELLRLTRDELRELARGAGVKGFGSMRKSELVNTLTGTETASNNHAPTAPVSLSAPRDLSAAGLLAASAVRPVLKNRRLASDAAEDTLEIIPLDSRWMQFRWTLSGRTLDRAVAAMGIDWHLATPILRVYRLTCDESGPRSKSISQDCNLPVDARQWFVCTPIPGGAWQVELGYQTREGRFFPLMHSLPAQLPDTNQGFPSGPMSAAEPEHQPEGEGAAVLQLGVEMRLCGVTSPGAKVTINDQVIQTEGDGTFEWSSSIADGRLVLPIEVSNPQGRQRVLMAVERNTRFLETEKPEMDEV